jgi:glycosyltransferase involved in cell wall biosynthesis
MNASPKPAILHAALHPVTGPWSVMRELALAQAASGRFAGVGVAVMVDSSWPDEYRAEMRGTPLAFYEATCPRTFGTTAFLWQRVSPPDWAKWIRDLAEQFQTTRVIVHLHNAWLSGVFLPLPAVPGIQIGVVATIHGVNEHFAGKPVRRRLHRWMAQRLPRYGAVLTSVDGVNTRVAEQVFQLPATSFHVVPNGMQPVAPPALCLRERPPDAPFVLGHVGSMIHQKGWHLLAEAAERLNRDALRVRVVLAGRGPEEESARAWANRHSAWAEFRGFVPNPRVSVMPDLDILCLMSHWEGLPMSIVEAMSVGLPVIATDVGGVREAVVHGETGLLVARTPDALADAVSRLMAEPDRLVALQARARQVFAERFTLARVVEQYQQVYQVALP